MYLAVLNYATTNKNVGRSVRQRMLYYGSDPSFLSQNSSPQITPASCETNDPYSSVESIIPGQAQPSQQPFIHPLPFCNQKLTSLSDGRPALHKISLTMVKMLSEMLGAVLPMEIVLCNLEFKMAVSAASAKGPLLRDLVFCAIKQPRPIVHSSRRGKHCQTAGQQRRGRNTIAQRMPHVTPHSMSNEDALKLYVCRPIDMRFLCMIGGDSNEYTDADFDDIREEWAIYVSNFIFRTRRPIRNTNYTNYNTFDNDNDFEQPESPINNRYNYHQQQQHVNIVNDDSDSVDDEEEDEEDDNNNEYQQYYNVGETSSRRHQKKRRLDNLVGGYGYAPPRVNVMDEWSENATFVLLEVWGDRYMQLGRRSLRGEDWVEVAEKISEMCKMEINDGQCRTRFETLKQKQHNGLPCGVDSGEYVFMNTKVYLNQSNALDEMRDSPGFKLLAESVQNFGEIYEKIEGRKRQQMLELEKLRMDFQRELELQKKVILERAQAEIAKIREEDDEDANSAENLSG
ncbi:trihelix protein [Artemisia annua]|uniref:Trihelix protein n=1 Tax=Artemisia annua TaxID=35608 RepID=A0A2U1NFJ8_ARTAN|nr:trihelix protein [Artemisia annua]